MSGTDETASADLAPWQDDLNKIYDQMIADEAGAKEEAAPDKADDETTTPDAGAEDANDTPPGDADGGETGDLSSAEEGGEADDGQPIAAPLSWSQDAKEEFAKLPRAIQAKIAERESERENFVRSKGEEAAQIKGRYQALEQAMEPYRQQLALSGADEATVIRQLFAAQQYLQQKPAEAIQWLAKSYGVELGKLAGGDRTKSEDWQDPLETRLRREFEEKLAARDQQTQQTAAAQAYQAALSEVQAFMTEVGEDGKPLRPHVEAVSDDMQAIARSIRAQKPGTSVRDVMAEAYERAVWANPKTRELLQAEQLSAEQQKRVAEEAKRAADAKKAAKVNLPKAGAPGNSQPAGKTWEDTLAQTADKIFEGAA